MNSLLYNFCLGCVIGFTVAIVTGYPLDTWSFWILAALSLGTNILGTQEHKFLK